MPRADRRGASSLFSNLLRQRTPQFDRGFLHHAQGRKDRRLRATGKRVAIVLSCGSVVDTRPIADADAIVYACLSGQAGARAVLNVLSGRVNPSGKLAETFPVRYADCSSASRFPGKKLTVEYREGLYVGYRYFDTADIPVSFPFGFGLSYTTFAYSDLKIDAKGVTFTLKNTGVRDGAEIAQLYISKPDGKEIGRASCRERV